MKTNFNQFKKNFLLIILFFITLQINSQTTKIGIYQAYISGDMTSWKKTMDNFSKKSKLNNAEKIELISYYYGYIGYNLGVKNKDEAQIYINKGEKLIDELIKNSPSADAYAFKCAFIGFKIGITPSKAPFLGKSSRENADNALNMNSNCIQANIEKGNTLYYAPAIFGGDKVLAKKHYKKAIKLFENDTEITKENWLYLSLLTKVAQIYEEEKDYQEAKKMYDNILKIEPEYSYVKNELYPELKKKL